MTDNSMKKYLLVFADYPDWRQDFFKTHMSPRNKAYCDKYEVIYREITDPLTPHRNNHTWNKFKYVQDWIKEEELKQGDQLLHLDADMFLTDISTEFPCDKDFNYAIDSGNTHCMGNYSLKINNWTKKLIDNILDEDRYQQLKDKETLHEYLNYTNSFWGQFREQASWYSLAGIKRHSQQSFFELPNFGWHSAKDEWTLYSLEELKEHVQPLDVIWNVTLEGHHDSPFYINKVLDKSSVKIRHFAGGTKWDEAWTRTDNNT